MKSYLKSVFFVLIFLTTLNTFSQDKVFRVGFTSGININLSDLEYYDDDFEVGDNVDNLGFQGGVVFNVSFTELLGLQTELLFESRSGFDAGYISVPILAEVKPVKGLSIQAGPKVGVLIYDEYGDFYASGEFYDSFNAGIMAGVQYVAPFGLFANIRPNYSFTNEIFLINLSLGMLF